MLTEEEAKAKWCPALLPSGHVSKKCMGEACMAWRWERRFEANPEGKIRLLPKELEPTHGYCGLAGKEPTA